MQEEVSEERHQSEENQAPLAEFAEVDGTTIYMKGLDYSLLEKQKASATKNNFIDGLKLKLDVLQKKVEMTKQIKNPQSHSDISESLISTIKSLKVAKPTISSSTSYVFDLRKDSGAKLPEIVTRRKGKLNKEPIFYQIKSSTLDQFNELLVSASSSNKANLENKIRKIIGDSHPERIGSDQSESQSDDIFGNSDSGSKSEESMPRENPNKPKQKKKLFDFGKPLSFGIKDEDIFQKKDNPKRSQPTQEELVQQQVQENIGTQNDKYGFMRKKVKRINPDDNAVDDYGECYIQSGPTFEQMKEYREQGIEIWGDERQAKQKERKPVNINREYDKVKKIIDEKSKK